MKQIKKNKIHLGVYGIVIKNDEILVIKKARGPYIGKYDLPGGRIEFGEGVNEALEREFQEEIGVELKRADLFRVGEYFCQYQNEKGEQKNFHHIGLYFLAEISNNPIKSEADGHDSNGAEYVPISQITQDNLSPIAYSIICQLNK